MLALTSNSTKTLAEVGFLLVVIAGVWLAASEVLPSRRRCVGHWRHSSEDRHPSRPVRVTPRTSIATTRSLRSTSSSGTSGMSRQRAPGAGTPIRNWSPSSRAWSPAGLSTWGAGKGPTPSGWPARVHVLAADISSVALGHAVEHARTIDAAVSTRIDWRHADLLASPPEHGSFDLVSAQVMRLTPEPRALFHRARRVRPRRRSTARGRPSPLRHGLGGASTSATRPFLHGGRHRGASRGIVDDRRRVMPDAAPPPLLAAPKSACRTRCCSPCDGERVVRRRACDRPAD